MSLSFNYANHFITHRREFRVSPDLSVEMRIFIGEVYFSHTLYNSFDITFFFLSSLLQGQLHLLPERYMKENRDGSSACIEMYFYLSIYVSFIISRTRKITIKIKKKAGEIYCCSNPFVIN